MNALTIELSKMPVLVFKQDERSREKIVIGTSTGLGKINGEIRWYWKK